MTVPTARVSYLLTHKVTFDTTLLGINCKKLLLKVKSIKLTQVNSIVVAWDFLNSRQKVSEFLTYLRTYKDDNIKSVRSNRLGILKIKKSTEYSVLI